MFEQIYPSACLCKVNNARKITNAREFNFFGNVFLDLKHADIIILYITEELNTEKQN